MLHYLSSARLPSKKAHVIQQLNMCRAFAATGEDVQFVSLRNGRENPSWDDLSDHYGLSTEFNLATVPALSENHRFSIPFVPTSDIQSMTYWLVYKYLSGEIDRGDVLYSRNLYPTRFFLRILELFDLGDEISVWFEQHQNDRDTNAWFYDHLDGVVCISEGQKRDLVENHPVDSEKVVVAHDGADLDTYTGLSTEQARGQLGIDLDEQIVMYTGHLYPAKDVKSLVQAAAEFDAACYIVGGYPEDMERIKNDVTVPDNVTFTGFVPPSEIPLYQTAADVVVATVADDTSDTFDYFSPLKLFEYMAAGKPMVVSRKSDYEEVLTHGENALFFHPGSVPELVDSINVLLSDSQLRVELGHRARQEVKQYGWETRARRILNVVYKRFSQDRRYEPISHDKLNTEVDGMLKKPGRTDSD
jgi:glycosyltransferase involved in cell wall biosynthesis